METSGTLVHTTAHGRLDIPFFQWAFRPLVAISKRRTARFAIASLHAELEGGPAPDVPKPVVALPTATFTPVQATHLATSAAAVAVVGFAAALVGQLSGPISHAFNASDTTLSNALAITRLGALIAFVGIALADRGGRRRSILIGVVGSAIACGVSAFSPGLVFFFAAQVFQRAFLIITATVASVAVVEEAPEGARAYATSMLALAGGFGYSFSVITLPIADLGRQAWRIPFVLGAFTILLARPIARRLAETSRYEALAARTDVQRGRVRDIRDDGYGRRFLLLAAIALLLNVFSAPSSQLTNKYLQEVHNYSNSGIALFRTVTTGIPGLFGLVLGGKMAEVRGRRSVAAVALAIATAVADGLLPRRRRPALGDVGHVDHRGERGRYRTRHAGGGALPHRDAQHLQRTARRDRGARLGARLRDHGRARTSERPHRARHRGVRHRLADRSHRARAAASRIRRATARRREPN